MRRHRKHSRRLCRYYRRWEARSTPRHPRGEHATWRQDQRGLKTIAFPAVGTGIAGFPLDECATIMLQEAMQHLKGKTSLEKIYFVLFDDRACDVFTRQWKKLE